MNKGIGSSRITVSLKAVNERSWIWETRVLVIKKRRNKKKVNKFTSAMQFPVKLGKKGKKVTGTFFLKKR